LTDTILVTGASGHLGRLVIGNLLDTHKIAPSRLIAGTRDPSKLDALKAGGVEVRKVDFDAPDLDKAFAGVGTLLIVSTDALDGAGTRLKQHKAAIAAAAKAGVKRLAYTSLPNPDTSKVGFAPDHLGSEEAARATGIPTLIFRNSWYLENLFMGLPQAVKSGQWYTSAADGKTSYVAREDIAAAIAGALANPPAGSVTYTLTGDEALTNDQVGALAFEIIGKPIQVVHVNDEQLAGGMKAAGVPEAYIPTFVSFDTATRTGGLATITGDTAKLSGRKLKTVRTFLTENKAAFAG
jgi:NAD(P)H dehydrogenase (quinone)